MGCAVFLSAQTTPSVNFRFTLDASSRTVTFINDSKNLGEGVKKAFWRFGDNTNASTGATEGTVHRYAAVGVYEVCLRIYRYPANSHDSVLLGSACKKVALEQACTAGFQWKDTVVSSSGEAAIKFTAFAGSNAGKTVKELCWKFGDGKDTCIKVTTGVEPALFLAVVHRYSRGGVYTACLRVVFDGGCVAEKCGSVTVSSAPQADSCAAGFKVHTVANAPQSRRLVAQPWSRLQKKPLRICWKFGDGKDTCIEYSAAYTGDYWVEHRYAQGGRYETCVSIRYDGGCESKHCEVVQINTEPPPPVVCESAIHELTGSESSLERRFYAGLQENKVAEKICWRFGDGTDTCVALSSPLNPQQLAITHRYAAPGNYNLCIRVVYAGGCVAERCRVVEVRQHNQGICGGYITDSAADGRTFRFAATGISGAGDAVIGYLWNFGDGKAATLRQVSHTYAAPGNYTVCVNMKTASGCETKICKQVVVAGTMQPAVTLSPNPVVGPLTVVFQSLLQQAVSVRIYNGNGVLIKTYGRPAVVGTNTWTFDLTGLPAGLYSLVVQSPSQFATAIFLKQ